MTDKRVDETIEVIHVPGLPDVKLRTHAPSAELHRELRTRRKDGGEKRAPLPAGDPRRLTDARCAWRKMTDEQRVEFLAWALPGATGRRVVGKLREEGWRLP